MVGMKQTQADRMAMIREAAKKFQKKQTKAARFTRLERMAPKRKKEAEKYASEIYWTDSEKYANEYYGEVAYHTTRFDNEWD